MGIPLITSKNLKPEGIDFTEVSYISEEDYLQIEKRSSVDDEDILFAMIGTIGNPVIVKKDRAFSIKNVALFKMKGTNVIPRYLKELLLAEIVQHQLDAASRGGNQKFVSLQVLRNLEIPLPPLHEQRRIAAILDKTDAVGRKQQRVMERMEDFLYSVFLDTFGDPVTNPKGWEFHDLGKHIKFITSGSRGWAQYYVSKGARFIRSLDVQMNQISDEELVYVNTPNNAEAIRTRVEPGDVLLTITGSRIGRVAAVPSDIGEAYISQHVAIIRLNGKIRPRFLSMFLSNPRGGQYQISRMQYGQTKPGLNLTQIRLFKVPCPPLYEQEKFLEVWDRFNAFKEKQKASINGLSELGSSLTYLAFRGELTSSAAEEILQQAAVS